MDILAFEEALVEKLSKELDIPENWKEGPLNSLHHKSKDYILHLGNYDETITIVAPKLYEFANPKLTNEIYKKSKKIFDDLSQKSTTERQEQTRRNLIEEFGLETRATKLKALEKISKLPDTTTEIELKLPKKKKWWMLFRMREV